MALHSQFADVKDSWNLSCFMNGKAKLWPQFKLCRITDSNIKKWEHNLKKNVLNLKQQLIWLFIYFCHKVLQFFMQKEESHNYF